MFFPLFNEISSLPFYCETLSHLEFKYLTITGLVMSSGVPKTFTSSEDGKGIPVLSIVFAMSRASGFKATPLWQISGNLNTYNYNRRIVSILKIVNLPSFHNKWGLKAHCTKISYDSDILQLGDVRKMFFFSKMQLFL